LELHKVVDHAIQACKVLKESHLDFQLLLIGDGREKANLKKLAKDLGIEKEVIFAGNRSQEWIAGALAHADLSIAPLTGRALLETALSSCPVVAYDVDWHGEIVQSGRTGELVENLNYQKLGEAALRLLQNNSVRIEMGIRMQELAMELADPEVIIKRQVDIYRSLTEKKNS
jgi:glycosyltransferase involved in cell wall biosynthesis